MSGSIAFWLAGFTKHLNIAIITHLFYRLVLSVISPLPSAPREQYEHSQLLPGSARLDNSSTEQEENARVR